MAHVQRLFAWISGYLSFDTFRSRVGAGLLMTTVFAIVVMLTPLAKAGQATVTVTGTMTDGTDVYGTFVGAGGSLAGQNYTLAPEALFDLLRERQCCVDAGWQRATRLINAPRASELPPESGVSLQD